MRHVSPQGLPVGWCGWLMVALLTHLLHRVLANAPVFLSLAEVASRGEDVRLSCICSLLAHFPCLGERASHVSPVVSSSSFLSLDYFPFALSK